MVVDMMKDNIHASVKALNGFCEFHYLLLQFIEWYPEIIEMADQKIEYFITNFKQTITKISSCSNFNSFTFWKRKDF